MSRVIFAPNGEEPRYVNSEKNTYLADLARAFNWFNQEKTKKEARVYLKAFIQKTVGKQQAKEFDKVDDSRIVNTFGWIARMVMMENTIRTDHYQRLEKYCTDIFHIQPKKSTATRAVQTDKPTVRDSMEEKIQEYIGTLEGVLDDVIKKNVEFSLYDDLKAKNIPNVHCKAIHTWVMNKASEFVEVYETKDKTLLEGYSNISRKKLTNLIGSTFQEWVEDIERYGQFKRANRKPRTKKVKTPVQQAAKVKYLKEIPDFGVKSVHPADVVGCTQVWVFNQKYKKLAVYRSDSTLGIQIKGTTLQNYDPDQSEQKVVRNPQDMIHKVLTAGKVQLRKLLQELSTKPSEVTGRLSEDWLIVRAIK